MDDGRESRVWRLILRLLLASAPMPVMQFIRRRTATPYEEFIIDGRRSGTHRHLLLVLVQTGGRWYAGHPNGTSQWVRNLEAAGECTVIRLGQEPVRVRAEELPRGPERDAVVLATGDQPLPAGPIYRGARRHIQAVGRYFRLTPIEAAAS